MYGTSGLQPAILSFGCRLISGNVGTDIIESRMIEIVGVAVGIVLISPSVPEIHVTSGLQSAITVV